MLNTGPRFLLRSLRVWGGIWGGNRYSEECERGKEKLIIKGAFKMGCRSIKTAEPYGASTEKGGLVYNLSHCFGECGEKGWQEGRGVRGVVFCFLS